MFNATDHYPPTIKMVSTGISMKIVLAKSSAFSFCF